jgi:hypothetical protein
MCCIIMHREFDKQARFVYTKRLPQQLGANTSWPLGAE